MGALPAAIHLFFGFYSSNLCSTKSNLMDDIGKILLERIDTMISEAQFIRSIIIGQVGFETQEKLYEKKQAAAFLGVSYRSINRWLEEGLLEGVVMGHRVKFKESELIEFRNRNSKDSGEVKIDRSQYSTRSLADIQKQFHRKITRL